MHECHQRIARAGSPDELLGITRDYLASWQPEMLGKVPEECRPARVKGIDDLYFWRDRLVDVYCSGAVRTDNDSLIRDLLAFFAAASDCAQVMRQPSDPMKTLQPLFSDNSIPRLFTSAQSGVDSD